MSGEPQTPDPEISLRFDGTHTAPDQDDPDWLILACFAQSCGSFARGQHRGGPPAAAMPFVHRVQHARTGIRTLDDLTARLLLPPLASVPYRDIHAPQNLVLIEGWNANWRTRCALRI